MSVEDLKKMSHDDLAKHAQEGWDLAGTLREENVELTEKLKRLRGPFTCHHAPEYAGGACAACHATVVEALQSIGRQCSGGAIKAIVDTTIAAVTNKK